MKLERLMKNIVDPFQEDLDNQELIQVNKRSAKVLLGKLCGGSYLLIIC